MKIKDQHFKFFSTCGLGAGWPLMVVLCCCLGLYSFIPQHRCGDNYDLVVAKDGSGNFTTIQSAIEACKSFPYSRIRIYIKNGIYHEKVCIPSWNTKISLVGESKDSTVITFGDFFKKINKGPNSTFYTATLLVQGNDFHAENITVENSAGPVGQALALAVEADRCSFRDCRLIGNQDTLYAAGENARQYFRHCYIEGTTDFIFGEATVLFEECTIKAKADSYLTAASTPEQTAFGFVFKNCVVTAAPGIDQVFLGRPWRKNAKTVFFQCELGACIRPEGWDNWKNTENEKTAFYAEYRCTGAGANTERRVAWSHQLTAGQSSRYTLENIFAGKIKWNPSSLNDQP